MSLQISLSTAELAGYVARQLNTIFPDRRRITARRLARPLRETLERLEYCFGRIREKYFSDGVKTHFNHLHSDQYAAFLYLLGNSAGRLGDRDLAAKTYYMNKLLHAIDVYFEVELPEIFLFSHPVGTVLGRARYADYLVVHQNVTVGGTPAPDMRYPTLGPRTTLYAASSVIGTSVIGENSVICSGAQIINQNVGRNSLVFGQSPKLVIKNNSKNFINQFFKFPDADKT